MKKLCNIIILFFMLLHGTICQIVPCSGGIAAGYPCNNVDLVKYMPSSDIGGATNTNGNDIWGWTDEVSGREFVLMGLTTGTSFIEISNPSNPIYLGFLPTHTSSSSWRDIKVYNNHAYIVTEGPNNGIQVFDLTQLLSVNSPPQTYTESGHKVISGSGGQAHNIVSNVQTGYMAVVGASICSGGLGFYNVKDDPLNPSFEGCYSGDGYSHDAICFIYQGPDSTHIGKEICIGSNENSQTIVDATDKNNTAQLSRNTYVNFRYTHQGWVTDDHRYLLFNDELDEYYIPSITKTRTHVMDISDLDNPIYKGFFQSSLGVIDHNLYVKGQYVYQAHYEGGLRILDLQNLSNFPTSQLTEAGYFDTYTSGNNTKFNGSWGVYPYFKSGLVVMSNFGTGRGLYILRPNLPHFVMESAKVPKKGCIGGEIVFDIDLTAYSGYSDMVDLSVTGVPAGSSATFATNPVSPTGSTTLTISNISAPLGNINLALSGRGPGNNSVHDIALSYKVISVPSSMLLENMTFTAEETYFASNSIELKNININSGSVLTLFAPSITISQDIQINSGGAINYIKESGCTQN